MYRVITPLCCSSSLHSCIMMSDNDDLPQVQPTSSTSWDLLNPTSFKNTLYIPALKISVTAGAFVRYEDSRSSDEDGSPKVGRVIEVATSVDSVPDHESHPLINLATPDKFTYDIPVQYARSTSFETVNHFQLANFLRVVIALMGGTELFKSINLIGYHPFVLSILLSFHLRMMMHLTSVVKGCPTFTLQNIASQESRAMFPSSHNTHVHHFLGE